MKYYGGKFMKPAKSLLILFAVLISFSCSSAPTARPLDVNGITAPVPVYSSSFFTRADLFGDNINKELFQTYFKNNSENIKEFVLKNYKITLEMKDFIADITNTTDSIQVEDINLGNMKVKRYYWQASEKPGIYAEFILTGAVLDDGTMPLEIQIRKDDPEYEPGYATTIKLSIKPIN